MIDHASIGVRDLAAAAAFYERVLATIGLQKLVAREGTVGFGKKYPEFWLNARPAMARIGSDTGSHLCLRGGLGGDAVQAALHGLHDLVVGIRLPDDRTGELVDPFPLHDVVRKSRCD